MNKNRHKKCQNRPTQSDFPFLKGISEKNGPLKKSKIGLDGPILIFLGSIPINFLPGLIFCFYIWSKMSLTSIKAKKPKNHGQRALKSVVHEKKTTLVFFLWAKNAPWVTFGSVHFVPGKSVWGKMAIFWHIWFSRPTVQNFQKKFFFQIFNSGH